MSEPEKSSKPCSFLFAPFDKNEHDLYIVDGDGKCSIYAVALQYWMTYFGLRNAMEAEQLLQEKPNASFLWTRILEGFMVVDHQIVVKVVRHTDPKGLVIKQVQATAGRSLMSVLESLKHVPLPEARS